MKEPGGGSDSEDDLTIIDEIEPINPEGYGIDGDFQPVAVFDEGREKEMAVSTEDKIIEKAVKEEEKEAGEREGEAGEGEEEEEEEEEEMEQEEGESKEKVEDEAKIEDEEKETEEKQLPEEQEEEQAEEKGEEEEKRALKFKQPEEDEDDFARKARREGKQATRRRLSVRKKSIYYAIEARIRTETDKRISGDFTVLREDLLLGSVASPLSITSFRYSDESYYDEIEEEEEEAEPIDREYYYHMHNMLIPESNQLRMKNNFLQRKMAEYFKKRKMEHVLKETDQQVDSQQKYEKKLDALSELKDFDTRQRNTISCELNDMRDQRDEQRSMLNTHFSAMLNREKEIGSGLINTKTGKEIPDKLIERLLKRQSDKWKEVAAMRLTYIKIRDRVGEKKTALHALDTIGDDLHLIDFEQLKIENQSHTDKIEERDEELGRLRIKCHGAMQCLAHIREKSAALLLDIQALKDRYDDVENEYGECRERLNYYKQERDYFRLETERLVQESGLLNKPKLLVDMEKAIRELAITSKELEKVKEENNKITTALAAIKKNIKLTPTKIQVIKEAPTAKTSFVGNKIYRGRPTLIYPSLPPSNWSELI